MKEANQEVYDVLFKLCLDLEYPVYNFLPEKTAYPFIYLGEQFDDPIEMKGLAHQAGTSITTVHVYGERASRNKVSSIIGDIRFQAKRIISTNDYQLSYAAATPKLLLEKSDGVFLWHGIVDVEINYSK